MKTRPPKVPQPPPTLAAPLLVLALVFTSFGWLNYLFELAMERDEYDRYQSATGRVAAYICAAGY
jgi:hypothetical protein